MGQHFKVSRHLGACPRGHLGTSAGPAHDCGLTHTWTAVQATWRLTQAREAVLCGEVGGLSWGEAGLCGSDRQPRRGSPGGSSGKISLHWRLEDQEIPTLQTSVKCEGDVCKMPGGAVDDQLVTAVPLDSKVFDSCS